MIASSRLTSAVNSSVAEVTHIPQGVLTSGSG
jgi:hypothetical protein